MTVSISDISKLRARIDECEKAYHEAFKTDSCRLIMNSYYEWQQAKKDYYSAIGVTKQNNDIIKIDENNDEI
jgi:putative SOS response-associated peptidase YedK